MTRRWKVRPEGANWGEFGDDDQLGRLNLMTPEKVRQGVAEVREGRTFSLSLPLDLPGGAVLNPSRHPPQLRPTTTPAGEMNFLRPFREAYNTTEVVCDDMVTLCLQYSTQWDALSHVGAQFDADGDGEAETVFYNGYRPEGLFLTPADNPQGASSAGALGIENAAVHGVQGRGVMADVRRAFGDGRHSVGYDDLMRALQAQGAEVERGDVLCVHTGFAEAIVEMAGAPDKARLDACGAVLDGADARLLRWIDDSGIAAIAADNYAVEARPYEHAGDGRHALLPLHELCLFKLGLPLGELWWLTPLADWLAANGRSRFLLTAPPLRLPGAVGSPVNPIATV
ncbi:MAG: cyclase family protein [Phenylobacterium sp.]|uniref:cyclase family protein n=1 Tax=Phenylobacterium sp. TaxID=1871053 RepID=UPI002732A0AF|nr:cyclase family protein [Phenylobacterium sp.]MDP3173366.1 cyclase family protein [Phenylobacterium sp.]